MLELIPFSQTQVNHNILTLVQKILNRSITASLDKKGIEFKDLGSVISALEEFQYEDTDAYKAQREGGRSLRHLSVSFLLVTNKETLYEIGVETNLSIIDSIIDNSNMIAVVSGTLEQWRTTIINGCTELASSVVQQFSTKALQQFEKLGLQRVFEAYFKRYLSDGTLRIGLK